MALCRTCTTPIPCHCHIPPARQITPGVYPAQPGPGEPMTDQTDRSRTARFVDALLHRGPGYDLDPTPAVQPLPAPPAAGPATPTDTDQAALRDRIAEALEGCGVYDDEERIWRSLSSAWIEEITPAVLAVLPDPGAIRSAAFLEAADVVHQMDTDPNTRAAAAELRRMADETQQPTNGEESPTEAARRFARRLAAVERLCSGRPGYHTITVKALLTAMSDTDDEAQQDGGES